MKAVIAEMPEVYVDCPHCDKQTATGRLWTNEEQINVDEGDNGVAFCEHCENSFLVHLDF